MLHIFDMCERPCASGEGCTISMMNCFESTLDVKDLVHQGKDAPIQAWQIEANGKGVRDLVHQGKDVHTPGSE
jgi:hypothetical protein